MADLIIMNPFNVRQCRTVDDGRESLNCARAVGSSKIYLGITRRVDNSAQRGQVAEWFKAAVLKTAVGASSPWVRIPPCPPSIEDRTLAEIAWDQPATLIDLDGKAPLIATIRDCARHFAALKAQHKAEARVLLTYPVAREGRKTRTWILEPVEIEQLVVALREAEASQ